MSRGKPLHAPETTVPEAGSEMPHRRASSGEKTRSASNVPRLALGKAEAAASLGCSVDFLEEHVLPELRVVYRGRRRLIPVRELERWLEHEATRAGVARL